MLAIQIARYVISFSWLYQGVAPKLIQIAPLEQLMSGSLGFSEEFTYFFIKAAGIGEVIWALIFFCFYNFRPVLVLNILALVGLLLAVTLLQPIILIKAFNPVTTNLPLIALSLIILCNSKRTPKHRSSTSMTDLN